MSAARAPETAKASPAGAVAWGAREARCGAASGGLRPGSFLSVTPKPAPSPLVLSLSKDAPARTNAPPTGSSFDKLRMRFLAWQPGPEKFFARYPV